MAEKHNPYEAKDTGHEWDGIRELKNDPPRWWINAGLASIVFLIVYFVLYPAFPMLHSATTGVLGWTSHKEYAESLSEIQKMREPYEKKASSMTADQMLKNPEMKGYVEASTKALFGDNCAACHGSNGQGTPGFPILADDDWLYGGTLDKIQETITNGRQGNMPAHAKALSEQQISDVVKYVVGLPKGESYAAGKQVFTDAGCVGCHGDDAKGNQDVGSANLTDKICRFDCSEAGIKYTVMHGVNQDDDAQTRKAIMPTFGGKLTESQIKELAVKVYLLGGGKKG